MKWPDRIAQAFRPGVARCRIRPEGAAEMRLFRLYAYHCRRSSNASLHRTDSVAPSGRILGGRFPRPEGLGCFVMPFHGEDLTHLAGRDLVLRENQRNPVTTNNARFRISGQSVPVFSIDRPKQPQSMLKPRTMALSKAPENIVSKIATHASAPLSQRPSRRQTPTHSSKAGRKTDNTAVAGHGVS
jgi:hypothetical protein